MGIVRRAPGIIIHVLLRWLLLLLLRRRCRRHERGTSSTCGTPLLRVSVPQLAS